MKNCTKLSSLLALAWVVCLPGKMVWGEERLTGDSAARQSKPVIAVEAVSPEEKMWDTTVPTGGSVSAWQQSTVSAETGGLSIVVLNFDVGSLVKKGDVLLQLNSAIIKSQLKQAQAAVKNAEVSLELAKSKAARGLKLADINALSIQDQEELNLSVKMAEAELAAKIAECEQIRINLEQTTVRAFDDGIISERHVSLGEVVIVGQALFTLIRQQRIEWRAELDSQQIRQIQPGMAARLNRTDGSVIRGRVRQVAPALDAATRLAVAYIDLPDAVGLTIGDYVSGAIICGEKPALTLPATAVVWRDGRSVVLALDAQQRVKQQDVTLGRMQDERVEVIKGVTASTRLVKQGGAFLNDGDRVTLVSAATLSAIESNQ